MKEGRRPVEGEQWKRPVVLFEGVDFSKSKGHGRGNGEASVPREEMSR
jgi:hypothetical protein